jgi:hypothetical protein
LEIAFCSSVQYTVTETEVGPESAPAQQAVVALEDALEEYLQQNCSVGGFDGEPDFLIGIADDDEEAALEVTAAMHDLSAL